MSETAPELEHAAKLLALSVTDDVIDVVRADFGNTNAAVLRHWRDEVARLLRVAKKDTVVVSATAPDKFEAHELRALAQIIGSDRFIEIQRIDGNDSYVHLEPFQRRRLANTLNRCASLGATAPEWQPIATAPTMRTLLLFAVTDIAADGTVGNWKMATGSWREGYADERSKASGFTPWNWDGHQLKIYDHQPTHWMPLPAPPTYVEDAHQK